MKGRVNPRGCGRYDKIVSSLDKCVFCDLKDKYIIAEDSGLVLSVNLFPYIDAHLLIIPTRHIERFGELSSEEWQSVGKLVSLGLELLKKAYGIEDCHVLYREGGAASGKSLGHLHWHIMPCTKGFTTQDALGVHYNFQELKRAPLNVANKLRKLVSLVNVATGTPFSDWGPIPPRREAQILKLRAGGDAIKYMRQACLLCNRSTCGYKTGCVVVKNGVVLAEGWNASLLGEVYCQNGSCIREVEKLKGGKDIHKVCSIHAEAFVVAECAKKGISLEGSDVYVSTFPCVICCRLLAKAGVAKVYYMSEYAGGRVGEPLLVKNGIKAFKIEEKKVWQK